MVKYSAEFDWTEEDLLTKIKGTDSNKIIFECESDKKAIEKVSNIRRDLLFNRTDFEIFPRLVFLVNEETKEKWGNEVFDSDGFRKVNH